MHIMSNRGGYTLVEVLLVVSIMSLIGVGAMAMMVSSVKCFDTTSAESFTDTDAVIAMQMIVSDVREAKSITIINGNMLRVVFPKVGNEGYYDRHESDPGSRVDYYVTDNTGIPGKQGTWLWRGRSNGSTETLKRNVVGVAFEQDTSRSVKITITTQTNTSSGPKQTQLTQRVVYLRNY